MPPGAARAGRSGRLTERGAPLMASIVPLIFVLFLVPGVVYGVAAISGARVIPFFQRRLPGSRGYELELLPPLENFPGDDAAKDAARIMQLIETRVRQQPAQYLWAHRRFKTRPEGEAPVYD